MESVAPGQSPFVSKERRGWLRLGLSSARIKTRITYGTGKFRQPADRNVCATIRFQSQASGCRQAGQLFELLPGGLLLLIDQVENRRTLLLPNFLEEIG